MLVISTPLRTPLTLRAAQVHATFYPDGFLTDLNEIRCQIGIFTSRTPKVKVSRPADVLAISDLPCDVDELWAQIPHSLYSVIQVLQALHSDQIGPEIELAG